MIKNNDDNSSNNTNDNDNYINNNNNDNDNDNNNNNPPGPNLGSSQPWNLEALKKSRRLQRNHQDNRNSSRRGWVAKAGDGYETIMRIL